MTTNSLPQNSPVLTPEEFKALETIARCESFGDPCTAPTTRGNVDADPIAQRLFALGLIVLEAPDGWEYHGLGDLFYILTDKGLEYFAPRPSDPVTPEPASAPFRLMPAPIVNFKADTYADQLHPGEVVTHDGVYHHTVIETYPLNGTRWHVGLDDQIVNVDNRDPCFTVLAIAPATAATSPSAPTSDDYPVVCPKCGKTPPTWDADYDSVTLSSCPDCKIEFCLEPGGKVRWTEPISVSATPPAAIEGVGTDDHLARIVERRKGVMTGASGMFWANEHIDYLLAALASANAQAERAEAEVAALKAEREVSLTLTKQAWAADEKRQKELRYYQMSWQEIEHEIEEGHILPAHHVNRAINEAFRAGAPDAAQQLAKSDSALRRSASAGSEA